MFRDKTLLGLNTAVFLMMLGVGMIVALLPQRVMELTGSGEKVGYLASTFAVSYMLLQVPVGRLSDRIGFKRLITSGYLLCFITGMLFFVSKSAGLIFLGRIVQGAGEAPVWALAPALLSIKYPDTKGRIMGIYNAVIHLGLTAGPIFGLLLSRMWAGNEAFLFYAVVCLIGAVIIHLTVDSVHTNGSEKSHTVDFKNVLPLVSNSETLIVLIGIALYGCGYGVFLTVVPTYLIGVKNFGPGFVGIFFSLFYIAISISQIITGPLTDRFGRKTFMIAGLITAAVGIALFSVFDQLWLSILLTIASLGLGMFYLSSMAFLNDIVPFSLKGTISGAYYLFWGLGMFLGPVLISRLGQLPGHNKGFYTFSAVLFAEAVIMIIAYYKRNNMHIEANSGLHD